MRYKYYYPIGFTGFAYCCITAFATPVKRADNNPPKVRITTPLHNDKFKWNSIIRYSINITDKEDGNSAYDEITAREVLLEVYYFPDVLKAEKYLSARASIQQEDAGLSMIKISDCFTCHTAKNKLLGPSFELIARRYPYTEGTVNQLTKSVIYGSSGVWGKLPMPAHQTIKPEEVRKMVSWILKNNKDKNLGYFPGTEGVFRTKEKPVTDDGNGVYVLTASYSDHGEVKSMQNKKYGQHSVLLKNGN